MNLPTQAKKSKKEKNTEKRKDVSITEKREMLTTQRPEVIVGRRSLPLN